MHTDSVDVNKGNSKNLHEIKIYNTQENAAIWKR